jgi:ATP-dependent DNA helicase RecQ
LHSEFVRERIKKINVSFIAIDEAHCISEWGHDFRPAYRKLNQLRGLLPETPVIALTATATKKVAIDIQNQLQFQVKNIIQRSFKREKLSYLVLEESQKMQRIEKMLNKVKGSALIYVRSRKKADELSHELNNTGFKSGAYHAGHNRNHRDLIQEKWMNNKLRIIVATNAFGMGIDKADVRLVIHIQSPETLEAYFQEAGRAGRDNKKSFAVLLFQGQEIKNLQNQFEESYPSISEIRSTYQNLANFFQISNGDGKNQSFSFDIDTFCKRYNWNKRKCIKILQILDKEELILFDQLSKKNSSIILTCTSDSLIYYKTQNPKKLELINLILRMYPGIFEVAINIKEINLAVHLKKESYYIVKMLNQLEEEGLIIYKKRMHRAEITLLSPRYASKYLPLSTSDIINRKKILFQKTKQLQNYIFNKSFCRSQVLLSYFDEKDSIACGICDICLSREFNKT